MRKVLTPLLLSHVLLLAALAAFAGSVLVEAAPAPQSPATPALLTTVLRSVSTLTTSQRMLVGGVLAALVLLSAFLSVRWTGGQLALVHRAVRRVLSGDYTARVPVRSRGVDAKLFEDFNAMVKAFRKKISIQKYVSRSTNSMIDKLRTGEYTADAIRGEITIFFSDVRGFTSFSERHDPMKVVDTLNTIFDIQVEAVVKHGGDIDKFIGDEVMALFPTPHDAFQAAVEIQKKLQQYNRNQRPPLELGVGIHCGEAVIGALGSGDYFNWTAIGNTVNVGKRLCSAAEGGGILVSEKAFAGVRTTRKHRRLDLRFKGIARSLSVRVF